MAKPPRIRVKPLEDGTWSALLPDGRLLIRPDEDVLLKELMEWIGENGTPVDDLEDDYDRP